jgi:ribonuclease HI
MTIKLVIYADGSCPNNQKGGPGGWAWATGPSIYASGHVPALTDPRPTNQRMELLAALEAVRAHQDRHGLAIVIKSDSAYVVNCFKEEWWRGWFKNGFLNSKKKPVDNQDLWRPLLDLYHSRGNVHFEKVKGHSGDPMNDFVDSLATEAARTGKGVNTQPL